jgi:hypothetical protein
MGPLLFKPTLSPSLIQRIEDVHFFLPYRTLCFVDNTSRIY